MSLVPLKCASDEKGIPNRDLIVILDDEKTGLCIERNIFLLNVEIGQPVNGVEYAHDAYVLVKNYPQYVLFQRFLTRHLRIIKGTIDDYVNNLVNNKEFRSKVDYDTIKHQLGKGTFGTVYAYGDNPIVVKISINFSVFENNPAELAILQVIKNAECCVADALEVTVTDDAVSIYMKRMEGDFNHLYDGLGFYDPKKMFYQLCVGLYILQSKGIVNRDIKSPNCLYDSDLNAYIADWGLGAYWPYMRQRLNYYVGTPSYRPPEVYQSEPYDISFDIFSLGLVGLDLELKEPHYAIQGAEHKGLEVNNIVLDPNYYKLMIGNLYGIKVTADLPKLWLPIKALIDLPEPLKQLIQWMICNDPKVRPTISQVLHHPYFDSERGTRTFPEISYNEMLRNSPPMNVVKEVGRSPSSPAEKLQFIIDSPYGLSIFLALAFYNRYQAKNGELKGEDLMKACHYLARTLIESPAWDKKPIIKNATKVAKLLNYDLMGCIPYLFFRKPSERVIRALLTYELAPTQPYHPYTVASMIYHAEEKDSSIFLESIHPLIDPPSKDEFSQHMVQACSALKSDKDQSILFGAVRRIHKVAQKDKYNPFLLQSPDKARAFRDSL